MFYFEKRTANVLGFNIIGEGSYKGLNFALLADGRIIGENDVKKAHLYTKQWGQELSKKLEEAA